MFAFSFPLSLRIVGPHLLRWAAGDNLTTPRASQRRCDTPAKPYNVCLVCTYRPRHDQELLLSQGQLVIMHMRAFYRYNQEVISLIVIVVVIFIIFIQVVRRRRLDNEVRTRPKAIDVLQKSCHAFWRKHTAWIRLHEIKVV